MPRSSTDALVERRLAEGEDGGDRYIDLRLDLEHEETGESFLVVGGRWDRKDKRYVGAARARRLVQLHEGQVDAARWFGEWFEARREGTRLYTDEGKPIFSVGLVGGRRAGKSDLSIKICVAYALENPRAIVWIIVPVMTDAPEVDRVLEELLPSTWYSYLGDPWFLYSLENGSEIHIKTSASPKGLKKGRVDIALIHEAQNHPTRTYAFVRPAIADRGGMVLMAANPPETSSGDWVEQWVERATAGEIGGMVFVLDAAQNPHVDREALLSIADEVDELTYEREILGHFGLAKPNAVFFGFSPENVERAPEHDGITRPFLSRRIGVDADRIHGMDFQIEPWQCAATVRLYIDPDDLAGDPLVWLVGEGFVPQGLEGDLTALLETQRHVVDGLSIPNRGTDPVVCDSSGAYQSSAREKGKSSWGALNAAGWRNLFHPDPATRKNPLIAERIAAANSLIRSASKKRKLRIDPVRCPTIVRATKMWPRKHGEPDRRHEHAHAGDTWTYVTYRLFPRRAPSGRIEYAAVVRDRSPRGRDLEIY